MTRDNVALLVLGLLAVKAFLGHEPFEAAALVAATCVLAGAKLLEPSRVLWLVVMLILVLCFVRPRPFPPRPRGGEGGGGGGGAGGRGGGGGPPPSLPEVLDFWSPRSIPEVLGFS